MARRQHPNQYFEHLPIQPQRCAAADNKYIYPNKAEAERAAGRAFAERQDEVRVYRDDRCGHWHLTSAPPRAQW